MEKLTNVKEDYLETILMIRKEKGYCLSVDIARKFGITAPSVSAAVKQLENRGYLYRIDRDIRLTESGLSVAERMMERQHLLTEILVTMGVSREIAENDACKIEHHLSEESYHNVKALWKQGNPCFC